MAFDIDIQRNNSEREALDKDVDTITTISGVLKSDTSIIDPVIVTEVDLVDIRKANYMYISRFARRYFITGITSVKNGLVEISGHVDVLSTYKEQIRDNTAIIKRQEKKAFYNLYLNDGVFKVYQNSTVLARAFPSGFTTQELVLAVAGK